VKEGEEGRDKGIEEAYLNKLFTAMPLGSKGGRREEEGRMKGEEGEEGRAKG
jgi:hypothetical protein